MISVYVSKERKGDGGYNWVVLESMGPRHGGTVTLLPSG